MASLINAARSITGSSSWFIKLAVSVCLIYFTAEYYLNSNDSIEYKIAAIAGCALLMFGYALCAMERNINNLTPLFPADIPGILSIFPKILGGLISILPGAAAYALLFYFFSFLTFEETPGRIVYSLSAIALSPFIVIPLVLYSVHGSIKDAYRFDIMNKSSGNVITAVLWYVIQFALIYGLFFTVVYYFTIQLLENSAKVVEILACIALAISFYTTMIYLSDLYGDNIKPLEGDEEEEIY